MTSTELVNIASMETQHRHPGGTHTVLVCVPGHHEAGPALLDAVGKRLEPLGNTRPVADLVCHRHLSGHVPAGHRWDLPSYAMRADMIKHSTVLNSHRRAASAAWRRWSAATAGQPHPDTPAGRALPLHHHDYLHRRLSPLAAAMAVNEPELAHDATEVFGIGLTALLALGERGFVRYAAYTAAYGHALLSASGRLTRSGGGHPCHDTLLDRHKHTTLARAHLSTRTRNTTVVAVHLTLPSPAR